MAESLAVDYTQVRYPNRGAVRNVDSLYKGLSGLPAAMQQMGYKELRPGQKEAIWEIMAERDTLAILSTSFGKSAVFQLSTLAMGWRTIIFSPLVALMRDQVQKLERLRIPAAQMSGLQSDGQNSLAARQWAHGELSFLYVAPERLDNPEFKAALQAVQPDMVTIDEAHVISGWSDNFRPSYTRIGDLIRESKPKVVSAFTATFPERVESDVRRVLCMGDAIKVVNCPRRTNLKLKSRDMGELQNVIDYIEERVASHGSVLVYCATIKNAEELVRHLQASTKLEVGLYHGELTDAQKKGALDSFMEDYSQVMVATNAFGMGVDKGNIYTIVHRDMPGSPESIDQEVGRAGRNGKDAECMMFVDPKSINTQRFFIMNAHPSKAEITQVFHALNKMKDSEGKILASHNDIAQNAPGVHPMAVSAAMQAMKAADVLLSNRASGKFGKVNFIGNSEDPKFKAFRSCVVRIGRLTDEGPYEVEPTKLADALAVKVATAQSHLRSWREKGLIDYIPPMRGSEIWMKGGLERVEFARLEQARNEAYEKLDKVLAYVKTPDSQKHAFLADYFQADRP